MTNENDIIDSVMSESRNDVDTDTPKVDDVAVNESEAVEQDLPETQDDQEGDQAEGNDDDDDNSDDLPKNVKKALEKNKRYIRNLREREKGLLAEIEKLKSQEFKPKELNEAEFEGTYGEFIKQQALEEMRAELGQNQQKQQLDQLTLKQQELMMEQSNMVAQEAAGFAKQSQDFAKVVSENANAFDVLPEQVQKLFFDLETPSLAAYALAKDGKIENLANMSPYMAAQEIYAAQSRGQQYLQQTSKKTVSNAPAPVNGVRGGANTQKNEKSIVDGLMKELYS